MNKQPDFSYDWISGYWPTWVPHIPVADPLRVLEIGCFEGRSTLWFLDHYQASQLTCLDTFQGALDHKQLGIDFTHVEERFRRNIEPYGDRVTVHAGPSGDTLARLRPKHTATFHVALVDGSHVAADVFSDMALTWPLLAPNALLIADDYGWGADKPPHERPAPALDAFLACYAGQYELLERGYQILLRKL
jgi:predicted O-methyltransferase YrrM